MGFAFSMRETHSLSSARMYGSTWLTHRHAKYSPIWSVIVLADGSGAAHNRERKFRHFLVSSLSDKPPLVRTYLVVVPGR